MKRSEFISMVAPVAVKVRIDGGVLFPSVSLAQTLLETGGNIPSWNNIVGYKVGSGRYTDYWKGASVSTTTWEVYDGVRYDNVKANWRAYDTIEDSLKDQALLFLNNRSRYQPVIDAKTPEAQARALQSSGYATDPQYANKLLSIMRSEGFAKYDKEADEGMEALRDLQQQVKELQGMLQLYAVDGPAPDWAKPTVDKLVAAKLLQDPTGNRAFFRTLVLLDRAGFFDNNNNAAG